MHENPSGGALGSQSERWREHGGWLMRDNLGGLMHGHPCGGDSASPTETWREHGGWLMRANQPVRCMSTGVAVT